MYIIELNETSVIEQAEMFVINYKRIEWVFPHRTLQRNNKWETFLIKTFPLIPNTELSSK